MACSQLKPQMNFTVFQLLLVFPLKDRYHRVLPCVLTLFLSFISLIFYKCKLVILTTVQLIFIRQSFIHCFKKIPCNVMHTCVCIYVNMRMYVYIHVHTQTHISHNTQNHFSLIWLLHHPNVQCVSNFITVDFHLLGPRNFKSLEDIFESYFISLLFL